MASKYLKNSEGIVRAITSDNLQLEKPLLNENYDIEVHNRNMDKIDSAIQEDKSNISSLQTKVNSGQNFKLTTDGGAYITTHKDATEDERNLDNKFSGWYDIYNCVGTLPSDLNSSDNNVFLEVKRRTDDYCIQYLYDVRTTRSWVRNRNKGVWADWKSVQTHKLTNDDGTSIGLSNADLNTITKSGNYVGNYWVNAPSTNYAIVEVTQGTSGMVKQVFTETTSTNQYMRIYRSSTWTDWRSL